MTTDSDSTSTPPASPPRRDSNFQRSQRSGYRFRHWQRPHSHDPRLQPGFSTLAHVLEAFPDELKRRQASLRPVTTYPCGVSLLHDKQRGCYRISFQPAMPEAEFKAFFAEHLKPLLIERHQLEGGPETRFYFQPGTKNWEMRYLYHARDDEGREIVENGKPKWVSCHRQVQAIAAEVAEHAATLLAEHLGQPVPTPGLRP